MSSGSRSRPAPSSTACPAGARSSPCRPRAHRRPARPRGPAPLDAGAQSDEAGVLRHLPTGHASRSPRRSPPENAGLEGRTVGDVAAERGPGAVRRPARHRGRRRAAHRAPPADARHGRGLGAPGRGVARPADGGRRQRRRRPPRHDVRGHLLHLAAGQRPRAPDAVSWEEAVHQLTDVPARLYGLRDRGRLGCRVPRRPGALRPRPGRRPAPSGRATTSPAARRASTPRPTGSSTSSSTAPRWSPRAP